MDEKQLAQAALQLLQRVDLKGGEVPAFVQIVNWLNSVADTADKPVEMDIAAE